METSAACSVANDKGGYLALLANSMRRYFRVRKGLIFAIHSKIKRCPALIIGSLPALSGKQLMMDEGQTSALFLTHSTISFGGLHG